MNLNYRSDNESIAHPTILDAVLAANSGSAQAYGDDQWTRRLDEAFSEVFETKVSVLPVSTGTAANSIALATVTPPWGAVYCTPGAHVLQNEGGAPEFFGNCLRLVAVDGPDGKMSTDRLPEVIRENTGHGIHSYQPASLTLTQCTESGTVYQPDEIRAITDTAAELKLATHMDGARFANAVVSSGFSPAELTWKSGIEMLSFGANKNGGMNAEALLFFGEHDRKRTAERLRKRSGHLVSKMRFLSAQLLAYLENGLWLTLAEQANLQAARFAAEIQSHPEMGLEFPVEANEVFVQWSQERLEALVDEGVQFYFWPGRTDCARFVFSHNSVDAETQALCHLVRQMGSG